MTEPATIISYKVSAFVSQLTRKIANNLGKTPSRNMPRAKTRGQLPCSNFFCPMYKNHWRLKYEKEDRYGTTMSSLQSSITWRPTTRAFVANVVFLGRAPYNVSNLKMSIRPQKPPCPRWPWTNKNGCTGLSQRGKPTSWKKRTSSKNQTLQISKNRKTSTCYNQKQVTKEVNFNSQNVVELYLHGSKRFNK